MKIQWHEPEIEHKTRKNIKAILEKEHKKTAELKSRTSCRALKMAHSPAGRNSQYLEAGLNGFIKSIAEQQGENVQGDLAVMQDICECVNDKMPCWRARTVASFSQYLSEVVHCINFDLSVIRQDPADNTGRLHEEEGDGRSEVITVDFSLAPSDQDIEDTSEVPYPYLHVEQILVDRFFCFVPSAKTMDWSPFEKRKYYEADQALRLKAPSLRVTDRISYSEAFPHIALGIQDICELLDKLQTSISKEKYRILTREQSREDYFNSIWCISEFRGVLEALPERDDDNFLHRLFKFLNGRNENYPE